MKLITTDQVSYTHIMNVRSKKIQKPIRRYTIYNFSCTPAYFARLILGALAGDNSWVSVYHYGENLNGGQPQLY